MFAIAPIAALGLAHNAARFEASAERVARDPFAELPAELVEQKIAAVGFEANIAMLKTADRMTKTLLDILV